MTEEKSRDERDAEVAKEIFSLKPYKKGLLTIYSNLPKGKTPTQRAVQKIIGLAEVAASSGSLFASKVLYVKGMADPDVDIAHAAVGAAIALGSTGAYLGIRGSARILKNSPKARRSFSHAYKNSKQKFPTFLKKKVEPFAKKAVSSLERGASNASKKIANLKIKLFGTKTETYDINNNKTSSSRIGGIINEAIKSRRGNVNE